MKYFALIAITALALGSPSALAASPPGALSSSEPSVDKPSDHQPLVGFTQLATNLPGGRHANVRTQRAIVMCADGTNRREIGASLVDDPDAWTQFAGWSPDGRQAIVLRGWQDPANAAWEEEHKTFRMQPGKWLLDTCLVDLQTGTITNVAAVDRVSHYNAGLFFLPEGKGLGFTALVDGVSKPHLMDLDGQNKRDVSGEGGGFAYGYSASPDGRLISYHENYQVFVANVDGSGKRPIQTGHPFDFAPSWSPDGQWLLFVSGEHYNCHPHVVRPDGTGLKKLADRGGYRGVTEFLDVPDFHGGSSDLPVWRADGQAVFYTAQVKEAGVEEALVKEAQAEANVELFQATLAGQITQLTRSPPGSRHFHPTPAPDGKQLLYGSFRSGARNLYIRNLESGAERQLTDLKPGTAAMWPHWQPGTR
jgi:TolB protein